MTTIDPSDLDSGAAAGSAAPDGAEQRRKTAAGHLERLAGAMARSFSEDRRILSFGAYLDAFANHPRRYGRNAAEYIRDMFCHYGTRKLRRPWGEVTRFSLFDAPWNQDDPHEPKLFGHEKLQEELFRVLSNFAREGRANRLVLMHGPNGSAKSTAAACVLRALEDYSQLDEGALYRFHWVFPTRKKSRGAIGFGSSETLADVDSYAHLDDADIDTRLVIELRDHPLFLLPRRERQALLDELWPDGGLDGGPNDWLYRGELCHKNKQIFEALLASYGGSLPEVLRHVQVERYFISRRYRVGAVTLGPAMSVDAHERQVTADRSLSALPTSLQATTLFEAYGELVDAAGGMLELSDLLKRPLDTFRYLQITLESGQVSLSQQQLFTNLVLVGSANDIHVAAFREHPEYASFRGRLELLSVPYLRSSVAEQAIYDNHIVPQLRRHVAPHTTTLAAEFAVLTRLTRPDPEAHPEPLGKIVDGLTVEEKLELYARGQAPARLKSEERKLLRANVRALYEETAGSNAYEGQHGMSPRTVRALLLDAAQHPRYACLSPFALLEGIEDLCKREGAFDWLKLKPLSGGYHDQQAFQQIVRSRLLNRVEADLRASSGLIDGAQYEQLLRRYITHVSAWVKKEKLRNEVMGRDEDPDAGLMKQVEELLGVEGDGEDYRHTQISKIAAWAIDNPGERPRHDEIFPGYVERMQTAAFEKRREPFGKLLRALVALLRHDGAGLDDGQRKAAGALLAGLTEAGYNDDSAADAASALLRERYAAQAR